jgi:polynucleotide 5'-hydroxyl-kinase GRC3/NOL9
MKKTVEVGKTLLVNGSASVKVLSGKVDVFGCIVNENHPIIVHEGKRQPFHVLEAAEFHISFGVNASVQEIETSTIPAAWLEAFQSVIAIQNKPAVIVVMGKVDSGKSSFSTYLVNNLIDRKSKVAILDGDLEQSDLGPPCTVAYGYAVRKVTTLHEVKMFNAFFVGASSPIQTVSRTIEGLVAMYREIMQRAEVDYVIINTDNWVEGEDAVNYKLQLVDQLKPDLIVGIQSQEELQPLLSSINTAVSTCCAESSVAVNGRVPEKRTKLRELNYAKYLKDAKVRSLFSSYMEIQNKTVLPKEPGKEKGILVGLQDSKKRFLGIGILLEYNRERKVMKVLTTVDSKPSSIAIGRIRLDPELKESPL